MAWCCPCFTPFVNPPVSSSRSCRRDQVLEESSVLPQAPHVQVGERAETCACAIVGAHEEGERQAAQAECDRIDPEAASSCNARSSSTSQAMDAEDHVAAAKAELSICRQRCKEFERMCAKLNSQSPEPSQVSACEHKGLEHTLYVDAAESAGLPHLDVCDASTAMSTKASFNSLEAVVELECEGSIGPFREISGESHTSAEHVLNLDDCGSLVIVGSERSSPDNECGWRMQELLGNQAMDATLQSTSNRLKYRKSGLPSENDCEEGWRWEEMLGSSSASGCASTLEQDVVNSSVAGAKSDTKLHSAPSPRGKFPEEEKKPRRRRSAASKAKRKATKSPRLVQPDVKAPEGDLESGWRWQEMFGMAEPDSAKQKPKQVRQPGNAQDCEQSWRWQECSFSLPVVSAPRRPSLTSSSPSLPHAMVPVPKKTDDEVAISAERACLADGNPQLGDIVVLGANTPVEYRERQAVVVEVFAFHCSVIVLDQDRRFGIGECWPNFEDVRVDSCMLRLGTRVVIDGMRGKRTQRFNGHSGTISKHPREGHPVLIRKPSCPDSPQLTVCVLFDVPQETGEKSALLEPRFLFRYEEAVKRVAKTLGEAVASLVAMSKE